MNSTISVKALLTTLLGFAFIAASIFSIIFYQRTQTLAIDLNSTKNQLKKSQSQLANAQSQLKQTKGQLSDAEAESQRRLSLVFAQEDNVKVLKECLAGVAVDDVYYRKGTDAFINWQQSRSDDDLETAFSNFKMGKEAMDSVSDDCAKASSLFQ